MKSYKFSIPKPGARVLMYKDEHCVFEWLRLSDKPVNLSVEIGWEMLIACLKAPCTVSLRGSQIELSPKDMLYIARPSVLSVEGRDSLLVIAEGRSTHRSTFFVERFSDAKPFTSGLEGYRRDIYTMISVEAPTDSLMAGYTEGWPGEWTSFPPHKHDDKLEVYVYYGLGDGYGLQLVYDDDDDRPEASIVRDYDAVVILGGYHPNVPTPKSRICYLWILCQKKGEKNMRVDFHPCFKDWSIGKTHLK